MEKMIDIEDAQKTIRKYAEPEWKRFVQSLDDEKIDLSNIQFLFGQYIAVMKRIDREIDAAEFCHCG